MVDLRDCDTLGLQRLTRRERIALADALDGSARRIAHAAACTLSDYRERYLLRSYGPMIAEVSAIADELRALPVAAFLCPPGPPYAQ